MKKYNIIKKGTDEIVKVSGTIVTIGYIRFIYYKSADGMHHVHHYATGLHAASNCFGADGCIQTVKNRLIAQPNAIDKSILVLQSGGIKYPVNKL